MGSLSIVAAVVVVVVFVSVARCNSSCGISTLLNSPVYFSNGSSYGWKKPGWWWYRIQAFCFSQGVLFMIRVTFTSL